ncbi:amidase [Undibacterium arcticum]|uniref:Amidase n=1 Tax=Undibacterium arcticum TaxID=1762892 RepID=A0ABV7EY15_9BURK
MNLHELGIADAAQAIRDKRISATELAQDCLARIKQREAEVGAWQFVDPDSVLEQARKLDAQPGQGPLHGVPIGVKDIINTADMPTEYGSPIYRAHRPRMDAAPVALLRRAGALIVGKTVTTEFAFFKPGKTCNPRNPKHTPGGSSSGSAAAVADRMVPGALGSQTAGSLIRPASYCGVVGYKPTYGDFDLTGVKGLAHSLDTLGTLTRSVTDAALLRAALLELAPEPEEVSSAWAPSIGLCRTASWLDASSETRDGLEKLALSLSLMGARVGEVSLPDSFSRFPSLQKTLMAYEVARSLAYEYDTAREQLSGSIRELIEFGTDIDRNDYVHALCSAEQGARQIEPVLEQWDILLAPSAPGAAPAGVDATGDPIFSRMWMLLGLPTISLPAFNSANGLPIGVQLVGARFGDERLLRAARWVERMLSQNKAVGA